MTFLRLPWFCVQIHLIFLFKVSLFWGLHSNQMGLLIPCILSLLYFMYKAQLIYMHKQERVLSCGTPMLNLTVKEPFFGQLYFDQPDFVQLELSSTQYTQQEF